MYIPCMAPGAKQAGVWQAGRRERGGGGSSCPRAATWWTPGWWWAKRVRTVFSRRISPMWSIYRVPPLSSWDLNGAVCAQGCVDALTKKIQPELRFARETPILVGMWVLCGPRGRPQMRRGSDREPTSSRQSRDPHSSCMHTTIWCGHMSISASKHRDPNDRQGAWLSSTCSADMHAWINENADAAALAQAQRTAGRGAQAPKTQALSHRGSL